MRDFTTETYRHLLVELIHQGYSFQTFHDFLLFPKAKVVIIRHDIDSRKKNALHFALIERAFDLKTSYYFRILPKSYDPVIMNLVANMGHEVGYHYEDLTLAKGDVPDAIKLFEDHLEQFRKHYPVKTICMHGSPLSKFDNRDLWKHINYRDYGIIGEPYFDVNYNKVLYLTDTGRRWDNNQVSVRDKVTSSFDFHFVSTQDIIKHISELPDQIMLNFHPQRWNDNVMPWLTELVFQNLKNLVKKYFFVKRS